MTSLDDFGGGHNLTAPRFERKRVRWAPSKEGTVAGFVGKIHNRGEHGAVGYATRRYAFHRFDAVNGFAISTRILAKCKRIGPSHVFVVDRSDDTVYEYAFHQWTTDAERVWAESLEEANDPQVHLGPDDAKHAWENHADDFYEYDDDTAFDRMLD